MPFFSFFSWFVLQKGIVHFLSTISRLCSCLLAGGNFNEVEKGRFRERLSKVDEAAAAAAAAQETRLLGLAEAQREQAAAALVSFGETLALNLEDIRFMEGLKLRQGKASAEMR